MSSGHRYDKCWFILYAWSLQVPLKFIKSVKISWNCTLTSISKLYFNSCLTFIKRRVEGLLERLVDVMVEKVWVLKEVSADTLLNER